MTTPLIVFDVCISYLVFAVSYAVLLTIFESWHCYRERRYAHR